MGIAAFYVPNHFLYFFALNHCPSIIKVQMSKNPKPKTEPFCIIGAVQYEILETHEKSFQIANWFHRHYSHLEDNKVLERKILEKTRPNGYYEDGDRIYVLSRMPQ
jgi:hypothetical protein